MKDKILVAYFQLKNNPASVCKKVAKDIATGLLEKEYSSEEFAITPVENYPEENQETFLEFAKVEKDRHARPAIDGKTGKFNDYHVIVLVAPNWFNDVPMAVYTFLEQHDLNGDIIVPVICHKGDGGKKVNERLREFLPNVDVLNGVDVDSPAFDSKKVAEVVHQVISHM